MNRETDRHGRIAAPGAWGRVVNVPKPLGCWHIVALVARRRDGEAAWITWCTVAGVLLVIWTVVELVIIPNGISVFYFVLGVLQLAAALYLRRCVRSRAQPSVSA